jgi:cellulose synthase/poly-beta-1,6-N-acetylglucosamine synthase-like glycosyltransferase
MLYFDPRIIALLVGPENIAAKLTIICFAILLNLFWFYAFYHFVIIVFSYFKKTSVYHVSNIFNTADHSHVALLYTTCNDFKEDAVLSCLSQDYPNVHTFILDDGDDEAFKKRIDEFCRHHKDDVTVMRRNGRQGFKAGNLNNCLKAINGFEYISVSDADTVLPKDYVSRLLPYFGDPKTAFVQSRQEFNSAQKSSFAQGLGYQIELHCDHYLKTKNKYGFVMFYGHGALMRTDVLNEIGDFPEVATEDLAYSMEIRQRGYHGVYAKDVTCLEEYPSTFRQYRKRNDKWIKGTAECLFKHYPSFFNNKNISPVEKFDVFVSALSLLLSFPFVLLLLLVGILLPYHYSHFQFQGPMFKMPLSYNGTFLGALTGISSNLFWRWDFFLMLLLTLAAPVLPAILQAIRDPVKKIRFIIMYTFIFYATQVSSACAFIAYIISRKAEFPVTGDVSERRGANKPVIIIECAFAILFLSISLISRNIWFLSFAAGIAAGILILKRGFENKLARISAVIPMIILAVIVIFIGRKLQ